MMDVNHIAPPPPPFAHWLWIPPTLAWHHVGAVGVGRIEAAVGLALCQEVSGGGIFKGDCYSQVAVDL